MNIKTKISKNNKASFITLPLSAVKCLSKISQKNKIICEINLSSLKKANNKETIDSMAEEARLEYLTGKTKGFTSAKKLIQHLES